MTAPPDEGQVEVLGTAHVSAESVEEVRSAIADTDADVVAVELDEARYRQLSGETPEDLDPKDILRGNTVFQFLAYWLLSYVQARLGERFGIEPGADMRAAIDAAEERGLDVALVDRDIQTTVQRFWARLTFLEKLRLLWHLVLAMLGLGGDAEEELAMEDLTDVDVVTAMLEEFRQLSPGGAEALIDERDAFIAHQLVALQRTGQDVLAVVGAGHVSGIERYLQHPEQLPSMASITGTQRSSRFSVFKVIGYVIAFAFLAFFFLLAMAGVRNTFLLKLFVAWFLFNGIAAFGLARLAGAHWQSATVGGLVAWLTSINPLLAPGWFAGYVELRFTSVNVGDIGTLNEIISDEESPMGELVSRMFAVPLFRLIAIVAMTNIGSFIASVLFPVLVIPWLAPEIGGVGAITDAMVRGAERSADLLLGALG
ncbi:MAG: TraB/GumN family protein [Halobacteriales archaeon]